MVDTAGVIASALPLVNNDWTEENQRTALGGVAVKQAQGAQSAFAGIDFNDPTSISNGITNLIKSNNPEKASALAGFAFTQQARQSPDVQYALNGGSNPTVAPNSTLQPVSNEPNAQTIAGHSSDILNQVSGALANIKTIPMDQRSAAIATLKDQLTQRGVPIEAVDQESNYILSAPDKVTQDMRLDEVAAHIGAHADLHGAVAQGQMPTDEQQAAVAASPHSPSVGNGQPWYLSDDHGINSDYYARQARINPVMKAAGLDNSAYLQTARELAAPYVSKDAELKNAGPIAAATAMGKLPAEFATEQFKKQLENNSTVINLAPPGSPNTIPIVKTAFLAHPENFAGYTTEPNTQAHATAAAIGGAAAETKDYNYSDPTSGETRTVALNPVDYINAARSGKYPGLGISPTATQAVANVGDANALVDTRKTLPNAINTANQKIDSANKGLALLAGNNVNPNDLTPLAQKVAGNLNALGIPIAAKDANNLAMYKQALSQNVLSHVHDFPGRFTDRDMKLVDNSSGSMTTPHDAASLVFAMGKALANRDKQWNEYVRDNPNETSQKSLIQKFGQNGPGSKSYFADPIFQQIPINGRPAVQAYEYKGKHYGLLLLGRDPKTLNSNDKTNLIPLD